MPLKSLSHCSLILFHFISGKYQIYNHNSRLLKLFCCSYFMTVSCCLKVRIFNRIFMRKYTTRPFKLKEMNRQRQLVLHYAHAELSCRKLWFLIKFTKLSELPLSLRVFLSFFFLSQERYFLESFTSAKLRIVSCQFISHSLLIELSKHNEHKSWKRAINLKR